MCKKPNIYLQINNRYTWVQRRTVTRFAHFRTIIDHFNDQKQTQNTREYHHVSLLSVGPVISPPGSQIYKKCGINKIIFQIKNAKAIHGRHYATSRKVARLIPDEVTGFFS
jgi:hypothetical protein